MSVRRGIDLGEGGPKNVEMHPRPHKFLIGDHQYVALSLGWSVCWSVGRSVSLSVGPSVRRNFEIFLGFGNAYDQIMILRKPYLFLFLFKCEKWPYKAFDSFKGYLHLGGQIASL